MKYQPPYTINAKILNLVAQISETIGQLTVLSQIQESLRLRRVNRIRTIQGSLAIEGNTLSEAQITAILDGKQVIAPPKEIQEVRNAIKAYEAFQQWQPASEQDLLQAHQILMAGLIDEIGRYRRGGVGVMSGNEVIHMAPPAGQVPRLMDDLLQWLAQSKEHPLIQSSIFHYEFEFIHPFADGNGRMGRLWQTLILSRWNPIFANIPVESLIYQHQQAYYAALQASTDQTDIAPFIEFMLQMIFDAIRTSGTLIVDSVQASDHADVQVTVQASDQVKRLIGLMQQQEYSLTELMQLMGLVHRPTFQKNYLNPALDAGLIERTQPDKPKSPQQRYRLKPSNK
ncbi:cell filamentation protein Fic [Alkanindiges hydrocarboniclasticus]|jgi:Fic family protein|uniref:Cell filamentation protein Fic n=1 Tax=Alkanindiges hydrocarboniclasticus TaxID=1907941 RepID=A0A1S8CYW0_9GAMM|nr:Fic family protein [Alkanindiges hydrocarboniclasticus]ONG41794.1 cell filamentation protein Fic [Alkanindiges hydrocarboniclasticus]